jgi:hypothetical protein
MSGRASRSFAGRLDEIRLSRSARYTGEFAPIPRHEPDAETALLFHADRLFSGLLPDHSASGAHGSPSGNAVVSPSP